MPQSQEGRQGACGRTQGKEQDRQDSLRAKDQGAGELSDRNEHRLL